MHLSREPADGAHDWKGCEMTSDLTQRVNKLHTGRVPPPTHQPYVGAIRAPAERGGVMRDATQDQINAASTDQAILAPFLLRYPRLRVLLRFLSQFRPTRQLSRLDQPPAHQHDEHSSAHSEPRAKN